MTRKPIYSVPPPPLTEKTAIRVLRGHTMGLIEDGWLIYYEHNETPPRPDIDGKLCIVKTIDGRILTRKVRAAWAPDRWDLETVNGEQLFNQPLIWAEPVTLIQPHVLSDEEKATLVAAEER